jgi:hypothetical protein
LGATSVCGAAGDPCGKPLRPRGVKCENIAELLTTVDSKFPLTSIFTENEHPDECYIGVVRSLTSRTVRLLEIDPRANWDTSTTSWPLRDITRVDFGGRYEKALIDVGRRPS